MNLRMCGLSSLTLALVAAGAIAFAAPEAGDTTTHDGQVVSVTGNTVVMTAKGAPDGTQHTHTLAAEAIVTLDGQVCQPADLKPGTKIRVTTAANQPSVATAIEAIVKQAQFVDTHDGQLVSMAGRKFVMTGQDGKEHSHTLATNAAVTCDGKPCQMSELKAGMKIRVTTRHTDAGTATEIEALNKNATFA